MKIRGDMRFFTLFFFLKMALLEQEKEAALREISELKRREMKKIKYEKDLLERRRALLDSEFTKR
jgi:hypothetical protein